MLLYYSLEHQICINPQNKTLFPPVWVTFEKNYNDQQLQEDTDPLF